MTKIPTDKLFVIQAKEIIRLHKEGSLDELKDLLFPYLEEPGIQYPDIPVTKWESFNQHYVFDWDVLFPSSGCWDYFDITHLERFQISMDEIHRYAMNNIYKQKVLFKSINENVYCLKLDNQMVPSITCSILLMDNVWEKVYRKMGRPYYVFPLYRELVFAVSEDWFTMHKWDHESTIRQICNLVPQYAVPFSEKVFFFNGKKILQLT